MEVTFTPTPAGSDPYWIDYGDGSWEYIDAGGPASHTYDEVGTYTFIAYRGASTFTGTVTTIA